jgi:rRNA maturation RNase YbeY
VRTIAAISGRLKDRAEFERLSPFLCSLAARVPPRRAFVEINCVGERKMAFLNRVHRGRAGAAEILTFHYGGGPDDGMESPLGEIYLCWARMRRGAKRRGVSRKAYAARLLAHGLFHLRGWRHDSEESEARMEAAERRFLQGRFSERVLKRLFA